MPEELRQCTECKQVKKLNPIYFYRNSHGQYGYAAKCKMCVRKLRRNRYHKEQARQNLVKNYNAH